MLENKYIIYGLIDPITGELRYVGRSSSGLTRPRRHWRDKEFYLDTYCARWSRTVVRRGFVPGIWIIEAFDFCEDINDVLNKAEISWIAHFKSMGCRLTNLTAGGEGTLNLSREVIEKRTAKIRGRRHTPEACAKMSAAQKGKKHNEERRAKNSAAQKGKILPEKTRKKISESNKGKKRSEQARANISAGRKGMKFSKEHRTNMSVVRMGKKRTEEDKKKISKALLGRKLSVLHKERLSRAAKNRKYTPEGLAKIKEAAILREGKKNILKNGLL